MFSELGDFESFVSIVDSGVILLSIIFELESEISFSKVSLESG